MILLFGYVVGKSGSPGDEAMKCDVTSGAREKQCHGLLLFNTNNFIESRNFILVVELSCIPSTSIQLLVVKEIDQLTFTCVMVYVVSIDVIRD